MAAELARVPARENELLGLGDGNAARASVVDANTARVGGVTLEAKEAEL